MVRPPVAVTGTCRAFGQVVSDGDSGAAGLGIVLNAEGFGMTHRRRIRRTTRDRAAIIATTQALRLCPRGWRVDLHIENRRVEECLKSDALSRWREDGWKARVGKKPVKDSDLWRELLVESELRSVHLLQLMTPSDEAAIHDAERLAETALSDQLSWDDPLYARSLPEQEGEDKKRPDEHLRRLAELSNCTACEGGVLRKRALDPPRWVGSLTMQWVLVCDRCGNRRICGDGLSVVRRRELAAV
jgi:ribonuclease HI